MVPDSLTEGGRSFGGRSRRQDTTWQGFRTDQEEQRVRCRQPAVSVSYLGCTQLLWKGCDELWRPAHANHRQQQMALAEAGSLYASA